MAFDLYLYSRPFCLDAGSDYAAYGGGINVISLLREKTQWVCDRRLDSLDFGEAAALLFILASAVVLGLALPIVADCRRRVKRRFSRCSDPGVIQSGDLFLLYHLVYDRWTYHAAGLGGTDFRECAKDMDFAGPVRAPIRAHRRRGGMAGVLLAAAQALMELDRAVADFTFGVCFNQRLCMDV